MDFDVTEALPPADAAGGKPGHYDIDLVTGQVSLSVQGCRLLGLAEARHLTVDGFRGRLHPADRRRMAEETAEALADPARLEHRARFRIQREDGSATWLEARGRIERDQAGRAIRSTGALYAVTGRKRAETLPDRGPGQFESALANSSIVVFQQDLSLRYTWIHDPKRATAGHCVLGRTDAELSDPEVARPIDAIKREVIETGVSARQEVVMPGREGLGRYDLYVEPRRDDTGAIVGVTCAAIEIARERCSVGVSPISKPVTGDRAVFLSRIDVRDQMRLADHALFTVCIDVLRRKLGGYTALTRQDAALLGLLEKRRRFVPARQKLKIDSTAAYRSWLIGSGWVYSYAVLSSGERQVMGFHLPGDLIGASGQASSGWSYSAVTDCVICEFDRDMVAKLRASETRLPEALQWADARERTILQQHLISIGRRSARARVAHLLLELGARLKLVGLADELGYACPLSQELLGDALGLTKIHVNRMLRELRELNCLTFRNGYVTFGDMARLTELAEFDPAYLDLRESAPATQTGLAG